MTPFIDSHSGIERPEPPIRWITSEEMLFTAESKYQLRMPEDFPLSIRFYQFTEAHPVIPNYHDFYEISYFYSGEGSYHLADLYFPIHAGTIVLVQAGQMHNVTADPKSRVRTASVYFMPELMVPPGSKPYEYDILLPFLSQDTSVTPCFHERDLHFSMWEWILEMDRLNREAGGFYRLEMKNRVNELLWVFLNRIKDRIQPSLSPVTPMKKTQRLEKAFAFIHAGYAEPISLEQLAEIACMSRSYFCRYFKQVTGLTPVHYLLRYRIDRAKELLINTDLSITEIAFRTGFNSQSYFDRIFQRFTRLSPHLFRQSYSPAARQSPE